MHAAIAHAFALYTFLYLHIFHIAAIVSLSRNAASRLQYVGRWDVADRWLKLCEGGGGGGCLVVVFKTC